MTTQSGLKKVKVMEQGQRQKDKGPRERRGGQKLEGEAGRKYSKHKSKHFYVHNPSWSARVRANTGPALSAWTLLIYRLKSI